MGDKITIRKLWNMIQDVEIVIPPSAEGGVVAGAIGASTGAIVPAAAVVPSGAGLGATDGADLGNGKGTGPGAAHVVPSGAGLGNGLGATDGADLGNGKGTGPGAATVVPSGVPSGAGLDANDGADLGANDGADLGANDGADLGDGAHNPATNTTAAPGSGDIKEVTNLIESLTGDGDTSGDGAPAPPATPPATPVITAITATTATPATHDIRTLERENDVVGSRTNNRSSGKIDTAQLAEQPKSSPGDAISLADNSKILSPDQTQLEGLANTSLNQSNRPKYTDKEMKEINDIFKEEEEEINIKNGKSSQVVPTVATAAPAPKSSVKGKMVQNFGSAARSAASRIVNPLRRDAKVNSELNKTENQTIIAGGKTRRKRKTTSKKRTSRRQKKTKSIKKRSTRRKKEKK